MPYGTARGVCLDDVKVVRLESLFFCLGCFTVVSN